MSEVRRLSFLDLFFEVADVVVCLNIDRKNTSWDVPQNEAV